MGESIARGFCTYFYYIRSIYQFINLRCSYDYGLKWVLNYRINLIMIMGYEY